MTLVFPVAVNPLMIPGVTSADSFGWDNPPILWGCYVIGSIPDFDSGRIGSNPVSPAYVSIAGLVAESNGSQVFFQDHCGHRSVTGSATMSVGTRTPTSFRLPHGSWLPVESQVEIKPRG